jgi:chemotaxis protein histidine kinase CheA
MTEDIFAAKVAQVRQRFISTLDGKIAETCAALPRLGADVPPDTATAAVTDAYQCIHGIVGIGSTVGFPAIGSAARDVEDVLRSPYKAGRALTPDEISLLKNTLQTLRTVATRELQVSHSPSQMSAWP